VETLTLRIIRGVFIDFDGTIYAGDSFRDACFSIPSVPQKFYLLFLHCFAVIRWVKLETLKRVGTSILLSHRETEAYRKFVKTAELKIWQDFAQQAISSGDEAVVVTASPEFLVDDILSHVNFGKEITVVGSKFQDSRFLHVFGEDKRHSFRLGYQAVEDLSEIHFWGDSDADLRLLPYVDKFFLCTKGKVVQEIQGLRSL